MFAPSNELLSRQVQISGRRFLVADSTPYFRARALVRCSHETETSEITFVTPQTEISPEMNDYNQLIYTVRSCKKSCARPNIFLDQKNKH